MDSNPRAFFNPFPPLPITSSHDKELSPDWGRRMPHNLIDMMGRRPVVFDGAMGTMLQAAGISCECVEEICLSRPKVVSDIHLAYLDAGSDAITTNTFGATSVALSDHGLADKVRDINLAAAAIARGVLDSADGAQRLVAGGIGPTSKLPTLGHIAFGELFDAYLDQIGALVEGGVDLILIETSQDLLQAKSAAAAARAAFEKTGRRLPVVISVTLEKAGTMLLGTELSAALAALAPYGPAAFGINCATGPKHMEEHLKFLSANSPFPIICQPNAGLPEIVGGRPVYSLGPDEFANILADLTRSEGIAIVGGCCGTTPEHIEALVSQLRGWKSRRTRAGSRGGRNVPRPSYPAVSSLYTSVPLKQEPRPFIVAEQTNVNGSKRFRAMLMDSDFDAMADAGRKAADFSHALDVCVAYAGRDEVADIARIIPRLVLRADAALMIDSTNPDAIEKALSLAPGRAIINSINLEDGGEKAKRILGCARRFGAAVVGLTIDESGMARSVEAKLGVATRLTKLVEAEGLGLGEFLIDPLTFTLASGEPTLRDAGVQTLAAIGALKKKIEGARTILGVSNISFGLPPPGRKFLTSVFLHMALGEGLDAAIINPASILPLDRIPEDARHLCERLIANDAGRGDPLAALIKYCDEMKGAGGAARVVRKADLSPEEELRSCIIEARREGLEKALNEALKVMAPADVINKILLRAMEEVGEKFGEGAMPLPFVLQSAETMRFAIDRLSPLLHTDDQPKRGTIVIATVRGDVHDIGKNLVDVILSNNGFGVINLGIRQPASSIIDAAKAHGADAIGLSGLLVSSTEVMREDLETFRDNGIVIPVLCGGAALTRSFVENNLRAAYGNPVYYCADAFAGLDVMKKLVQI